jgi:hypothetical protein
MRDKTFTSLCVKTLIVLLCIFMEMNSVDIGATMYD